METRLLSRCQIDEGGWKCLDLESRSSEFPQRQLLHVASNRAVSIILRSRPTEDNGERGMAAHKKQDLDGFRREPPLGASFRWNLHIFILCTELTVSTLAWFRIHVYGDCYAHLSPRVL